MKEWDELDEKKKMEDKEDEKCMEVEEGIYKEDKEDQNTKKKCQE